MCVGVAYTSECTPCEPGMYSVELSQILQLVAVLVLVVVMVGMCSEG